MEVKHLSLFTDTEINTCFSTKQVARQHPIVRFFLSYEEKLEIQKNAGRWKANTTLCLSSQSECAKTTIHWFGMNVQITQQGELKENEKINSMTSVGV